MCDSGTFRSLADFQNKYGFPCTAYLQIRHAAAAQLGLVNVSFSFYKSKHLLNQPQYTKLISLYCFTFIHIKTKRLMLTKQQWQEDISDLPEDAWGNFLYQYITKVICSRDKLIQLKYLHHIYYIPYRLFRMGKIPTPTCHRCGSDDRTFFHTVWQCPIIRIIMVRNNRFYCRSSYNT